MGTPSDNHKVWAQHLREKIAGDICVTKYYDDDESHSIAVFFSRQDGGEVDTTQDLWKLFPIFDTSDKNRLKRTANDIVRETASARDWTGFPPEAVAIASNGLGDIAILLPSKEDDQVLQDIVFRWNHETRVTSLLSPTTAIWFNTRS